MGLKRIAALAILLLAVPVGAEEPSVLKTQQDRVSYGLGVDLGRNLKRQGIEFDLDLMVKGLRDEFSGGKLLMTDEELHITINMLQTEMKRRQIEVRQRLARAAEDNRKAGEAFLAENKAKEGVVTRTSGLQYRILKAGDGRTPTEADTVECRYRGTLIDGAEVESSPRDGRPALLQVKAAIAGLKEALKIMPAGSKWQIFIPARLAYGARGSGPVVGPNAALVYELELIAIR